MAPKRRGNKLVGSVVKTKVVQETVEVIVADDDGPGPEQQLVPEAPPLAPPAVDVSGSTVVHVEVTTPDGGDDNATGSIAKQPAAAAAKRGRRRREEEQRPAPPEDSHSTPVNQVQETQDPNEQEQEEDDTSKKKKKKKKKKKEDDEEEDEDEEQQPETSRVASERKATATATKTKTKAQQQAGGGDAAGKRQKQQKARRRLLGGDGGMGGYKRYVWRVLKQVHPDLGVSGHAMQVLDMMMADMFERLADEAARLSKATGRITLTSREVQSAVRLVLPGELGRHAISEGTKAISKYMSYA